ncbi:hypothetical protein ACET3Z_003392 [Daucus carota]
MLLNFIPFLTECKVVYPWIVLLANLHGVRFGSVIMHVECLHLGNSQFVVASPFTNVYKVPLVNQENGIPGPELNETRMKYRSDKILQLGMRHH